MEMIQKRFNLLFFTTILVSPIFAQTSISVDAGPNVVISQYTNVSSHISVDSLKSATQIKWSPQFQIGIQTKINKDLWFQVALGYSDLGMVQVNEDIQLLEVIHPKLGKLTELSGTNKKSIANYHLRQLEIPIGLILDISKRTTYNKWRNYIHLGISPSILFQNQLKIKLEGFSKNGETVHVYDDDLGLEVQKFNVAAWLGYEFLYNIQPGLYAGIKPIIHLPFLTVAKHQNYDIRNYSFRVKASLTYEF